MGCIYLAVNKINGKAYVGQTTRCLQDRKKEHESYAAKNDGYVFHTALTRHGISNFEWHEVYTDVSKEQLNELEIECILWFNTKVPNGYNLTDGGYGAYGRKHNGTPRTLTDEHKNKIRITMTGKVFGPCSEETKNKISKANKGKKASLETRAAMSKSHTGAIKGPPSEETKNKISKASRGKKRGPHSEEHARKIGLANKGKKRRPHSEETKAILSKISASKKHTEETKNKISKANKGKVRTPEMRFRMSTAAKNRKRNKT